MPPYRPTQAEVNRFAAKNTGNNFSSLKAPQVGGPGRITYDATNFGASTNVSGDFQGKHPRYPDYIYPDDSARDTYYSQMYQVEKMNKEYGKGDVVHTVSPGEVKYWQDKRNAQEAALFKLFVEDSLPRGTPWAREFFERIMPGWYQSKIDIIQDKLSTVNRFIDITIRGPQNIDDMWLLYQLYSGRIALPEKFSDLITGGNTQEISAKQFASGLFNPRKYTDNLYRVSIRNQRLLANFAIPGIDTKGLSGTALVTALMTGTPGTGSSSAGPTPLTYTGEKSLPGGVSMGLANATASQFNMAPGTHLLDFTKATGKMQDKGFNF